MVAVRCEETAKLSLRLWCAPKNHGQRYLQLYVLLRRVVENEVQEELEGMVRLEFKRKQSGVASKKRDSPDAWESPVPVMGESPTVAPSLPWTCWIS